MTVTATSFVAMIVAEKLRATAMTAVLRTMMAMAIMAMTSL